MSSLLKNNTEIIQELLNTINNLPEAGTDLPELTNEGSASDLLSGKQLIDSDGNVVDGTFTIDTELDTQDNLISQIQTALQNKAAGSEPVLQNKTITPTTSAQTVTPDSGYDGLSQVTVNAMPTATQATPSISVDSAGKITATATQTAGYVTAGTKSGTKQLTTQAAKTITPSTSSQTAVAKGVYTTGVVTVGAIPSTYVKPTATKAATTYTPTTSNQTIAAGTYCSGTQTIKGDANLKAENIAEGVSIFGVTGTHSGGSGGGIEYEIVNLTNEGTSIPFTLKRITSTFGMMTTSDQVGLSTKNVAHYNLSGMSAFNYQGGVSSFLRGLFFEKGVLTSGSNFIAPYVAVFINDPSAEAIYEE